MSRVDFVAHCPGWFRIANSLVALDFAGLSLSAGSAIFRWWKALLASFQRGGLGLLFCVVLPFSATLPSTVLAIPVAQLPDSTEPQRVDAHGDPLPDGALLRLGTIRFQNPYSVAGLELSPDGNTLVSMATSATIAWDAASGRVRWRRNFERPLPDAGLIFAPSAYGSHPMSFSPDGKKIYSSGSAGQVLIWDVDSGEWEQFEIDFGEHRPLRPNDVFKSIDLSPTRERIALGCASAFYVCDQNGNVMYSVNNDPEQPFSKQKPMPGVMSDRLSFGGEFSYGLFSPDGLTLALVNSEAPREIRVLAADDGAELQRIETTDRVVRMDFGPEGKFIVATERDSSVRKYELETSEEIWSVTYPEFELAENDTSCVLVSPQGDWVAVGTPLGPTNLIRVIDYDMGEEIAILRGHQWKPWLLAVAQDGKTLYSSGWDKQIIRWDMESYVRIEDEGIHRATGISRASTTDHHAAYVTDDGLVRVVDTLTDEEIVVLDPEAKTSALEFSSDGNFLATGGQADWIVQVVVWEIATGRAVHRWQWPVRRDPHSTVESLRFSNDGKRLAACVFRQSRGYLFDLESDEQRYEFRHSMVFDVAFSPDGRTLASVGWDSKIQFRDVDGDKISTNSIDVSTVMGDQVGDQTSKDWRMYGIRYSPDGDRLASIHMDGQIVTWDTADGQVVRMGNHDRSNSFAWPTMDYSPEGAWIILGNRQGEAKLLDALTLEEVWTKQVHEDSVRTINFAVNGRTILTSGGGVCYLWDLTPGQLDFKPLDQLYSDLLGSDSQAAWNALWAMLADPDNAVSLLGERLIREIKEVEPSRVQPLIDDLGSESFETRSSAQRALNEIGPGVEPLLQEALERATAAEQVSRIREVLRELKREVYLRPLAVLNGIDIDESRRVLRQLANEGPETYIGRQARRLLEE